MVTSCVCGKALRKRKKSPYWVGCYTLPNGERRQSSTKVTDKAQALQIVLGWERAAKLRATKDQAGKILADIVHAVSNETFECHNAHAYMDKWLTKKTMELEGSTITRYDASVVNEFKKIVPTHVSFADVPTATILAFRDAEAVRTSIASANFALKVIKAMFKTAWNDGIIPENIAARVSPLNPKKELEVRVQRRSFTLSEVRKLIAVTASADEWRGINLFGFYTGQRLTDITQRL